MPKQNETVLDKVSGALQREDWNMIVKMARDPATSKLVTTAKVGFGGGTALHMASYCHKLDVSIVLLDVGADLTAQDKEGYTPLHIAALSGSQVVADLLLSRGADVSAVNAYGWTPLHAASVNGHIHVALFLIKSGGRPDAPAKDGRTPATIAEASGRSQMAKILRQAADDTSLLPRKRRATVSPHKDPSVLHMESTATNSRRKKFEQDMADDEKEALDDEYSEEGDGATTKVDAVVDSDDDPRFDLESKRPSTANANQQRKSSAENNPSASKWPRNLAPKLPARPPYLSSQATLAIREASQVSPVAVRNTLTSFGDSARHGDRHSSDGKPTTPNVQLPKDTISPGLPVLPPAPVIVRNMSEANRVNTPQNSSNLNIDIGNLCVSEVASLMIQYVCEGQDAPTKRRFAEKLRKGVLAYRLSGRALLAQEPPPGDLATAVLLGHQSVRSEAHSAALERDVVYYLVVDFIRLARLRTSSAFAFNLSCMAKSMRETVAKMTTENSPGVVATPGSSIPTSESMDPKEQSNASPKLGFQCAAAHVVKTGKNISRTSGAGSNP